jgi:ligand-binding sensor domain-containing protein
MRRAFAVVIALLSTPGLCAALPAASWTDLTPPIFQIFATGNPRNSGLPYTPEPVRLAQDATGFLWVGTAEGLERWDGYRFRTYRVKHGDPCALQAAYVTALYVDRGERLIINTLGGGLARYDAETDCIRELGDAADVPGGATIESIANDGSGGLWVGTRTGLLRVSADLAQVRRVNIELIDRGDWSHSRVARVLRDRHGTLWVGTDNGLARRAASEGPFEPFPLGPDVKIRALFESSDGRIWVGTVAHGAFVIDPSTLRARVIPGTVRNPSTPLIWSAEETRAGEIWLGTPGDGIIIVDPASLETRNLRHEKGVPTTLAWISTAR